MSESITIPRQEADRENLQTFADLNYEEIREGVIEATNRNYANSILKKAQTGFAS